MDGVAATLLGSEIPTTDLDVCYARDPQNLFGFPFAVIEIGRLIIAKRAAGRPKDLLAVVELEAIQERQRQSGSEDDKKVPHSQ